MSQIKAIQVRNSAFFGEMAQINFSSKMNCLMGSRGTGKTTILSMLYWAINQDENLSKEIISLIKSNLGSGTVQVIVEDTQGNELHVFKAFGDSPAVKTAAGAHVSYDDFMVRFGIDYFAAGAIEKIGLDPKHRLRLFDGHIGNAISEVNSQIGFTVSQLKQNEIQIKTCRREAAQVKEELQTFGNIEEEIKKAKADLSAVEADAGVKDKFDLENKKQTKRTLEQNFLTKVRDATQNIAQQIERLRVGISSAFALTASSTDLDSSVVKKFTKTAASRLESATKLVGDLQTLSNQIAEELGATSKAAREEHEKAEGEFSNLKQTIAKHREQFQRLNNLSQRATAKKIATEKAQSLGIQLKTLTESRGKLLTGLNALISSRAETRRKNAAQVNELLGQKVKILMKDCSLNESFEEILRAHLSSLQMRITGAERQILAVSNPQELAASIERDEAESYAKKCEILDVERIKNLFKTFKQTNIVFELESCVCEDAPNFYLAVENAQNVESFKPTEELSTGQRCTAVLPVIFAMTKRPLLIDQPEDNLDNRYITQSIHEIVRKIKNERQLIFVTHNPNIPVISDAESNTFLSYREQHSYVLAAGNIQQVKDQIVDLLEGGKTAFVKRKDIYGY